MTALFFHSEVCLGCTTPLIFHQPLSIGNQGLRWAKCGCCGLKHWLVKT